jgi:hypothetical protein
MWFKRGKQSATSRPRTKFYSDFLYFAFIPKSEPRSGGGFRSVSKQCFGAVLQIRNRNQFVFWIRFTIPVQVLKHLREVQWLSDGLLVPKLLSSGPRFESSISQAYG